jgi:hypothetical protein
MASRRVLLAGFAHADMSPARGIQGLRIGDDLLIGIPAELFVALGLAVKEAAYPRQALVVGLANGMVGYVPTREASTAAATRRPSARSASWRPPPASCSSRPRPASTPSG